MVILDKVLKDNVGEVTLDSYVFLIFGDHICFYRVGGLIQLVL